MLDYTEIENELIDKQDMPYHKVQLLPKCIQFLYFVKKCSS